MQQHRYKHRPRREEQKILVITNGQTEEEYFCQFPVPGQLLKIKCFPRIDNKRLLRQAAAFRQAQIRENKYLDDIDSTWIVIDRDANISNAGDKQHFIDVLKKAGEENVNVAYSNDAFELWYLLHFKYEKDTLNAQELKLRINKELKKDKIDYSYKKPAKRMYGLIDTKQDQAIANAKRLQQHQKGIPAVDANPSTSVYKLVEVLKSMRQKS